MNANNFHLSPTQSILKVPQTANAFNGYLRIDILEGKGRGWEGREGKVLGAKIFTQGTKRQKSLSYFCTFSVALDLVVPIRLRICCLWFWGG